VTKRRNLLTTGFVVGTTCRYQAFGPGFAPAQLLKSGEQITGDASYEANFNAICDEKLQERDEQPPSRISIAQSGDMGDEESFVDA
jgi:hypothetical protein